MLGKLRLVRCPVCDGRGRAAKHVLPSYIWRSEHLEFVPYPPSGVLPIRCKGCGGWGRVWRWRIGAGAGTCRYCGGDGLGHTIVWHSPSGRNDQRVMTICDHCGGYGRMLPERPPGWSYGDWFWMAVSALMVVFLLVSFVWWIVRLLLGWIFG